MTKYVFHFLCMCKSVGAEAGWGLLSCSAPMSPNNSDMSPSLTFPSGAGTLSSAKGVSSCVFCWGAVDNRELPANFWLWALYRFPPLRIVQRTYFGMWFFVRQIKIWCQHVAIFEEILYLQQFFLSYQTFLTFSFYVYNCEYTHHLPLRGTARHPPVVGPDQGNLFPEYYKSCWRLWMLCLVPVLSHCS